MTSTLRPDELASLAEIEREKRAGNFIKKGAATALGLGTAAIGAGISSRILPFINEYISPELAVKGISKISPKIGDFLKRGQSAGLDINEGLNFVKENIMKDVKKEPAKESRNVVQQYSPELHDFISQWINSGRSPLEAGAIAQNDKRFSSIIKKLSKDHKTAWSNIIQSVYGSGMGQPQASQPMQQPMQQQTSQQMGPGKQAFMEVLQRINQRLGQ